MALERSAERHVPVQPLPVLALFAAMTSIQFGATFAKGLFPILGAEGTTAVRLLFGGVMLTVALRAWRLRPSARMWPFLLAYGVVLAAMNLLFYASLATIPLGVAVTLEFTGPLLVSTLTSRKPSHFAWVGLAVAGVVLLSPLMHDADQLDPRGVLLALAAGACWALYIVLAQKTGRELGSQVAAAGTVVAALVALPFGWQGVSAAMSNPTLFAGALVVGMFSSALPFWLELIALTRMPARLYGTLTCLEPALGAVMGFLLLHETLTLTQVLGILAVVLAATGAALAIKPSSVAPE